jgi:hypothetical protein
VIQQIHTRGALEKPMIQKIRKIDGSCQMSRKIQDLKNPHQRCLGKIDDPKKLEKSGTRKIGC